MKKIVSYFVFMFLLVSCSSVYQEQELCRDFVIKTENNITKNSIDFVQIKEDLSKKLALIKSKKSQNICKIVFNTATTVYSEFSNENGVTVGNNIRTGISVKMLINDQEIFSDNSSVFYYQDTISHRYSNYNLNTRKSINSNISENLFKIIKSNIDRLNID